MQRGMAKREACLCAYSKTIKIDREWNSQVSKICIWAVKEKQAIDRVG